ncbi:MAG: DegQ family serine endoprotease [Alphaproteobacteria bacterium]|nr:DegQ family serine endoprotease [Alphaproteobacteria bacterium]
MKRTLSSLCLILALMFGASDGRAQTVPQSKAQIALSFAPLVKQITPAVVNIYTQKAVKQRISPFFNDPLFREFFGNAMPQGMTRERMEHSLGSGVMIRSDGLIVTSRHVVADADQIRAVLSDRREFDAHIVMQDERSDLAVLRLESKGETFPYVELRDSDEAQVGDLVLAIGNPFGVGQTVTMGIISALQHKSIGSGDLGYFIQTDAAINPGNSGGALITMDGKLIGINAAIYSRDGGNMGIGFAVPSNMVKILIGAVSQGKTKITHPWTGIEGQEVSQDIALSLGLSQPMGYLVKSLHPASPASKAGLKPGDVILSVNGHNIEDPEAFRYRTTALPVGTEAEMGILRKGQKSAINVPMIAPPETPPRNETLVAGRNPATGAKIANLSPAVSEELSLQGVQKGVVVTSVKPGSIAARVGLAAGDIIREVNGQKITDVDMALNALANQVNGGWRMKIRRGGNDVTLMLGG